MLIEFSNRIGQWRVSSTFDSSPEETNWKRIGANVLFLVYQVIFNRPRLLQACRARAYPHPTERSLIGSTTQGAIFQLGRFREGFGEERVKSQHDLRATKVRHKVHLPSAEANWRRQLSRMATFKRFNCRGKTHRLRESIDIRFVVNTFRLVCTHSRFSVIRFPISNLKCFRLASDQRDVSALHHKIL